MTTPHRGHSLSGFCAVAYYDTDGCQRRCQHVSGQQAVQEHRGRDTVTNCRNRFL